MISTNTSTDHLFSVLARNYWETQGGIWGPVLRDLPGNVNETHSRIYSRIYLLGVECSGCMSLAEPALEREGGREGGRQKGRGRGQGSSSKPPVKQLHSTVYCLFYRGCIRLPSYVRLTRGEKKLTKSQIK